MRILSLLAGSLAALLLGLAGAPAVHIPALDDDDAPGSALPVTGRPAPDEISSMFTQRSYRPGDTADLRIVTPGRGRTLQVFHAGYGHDRGMLGKPVTTPARVGRSARVTVHVGDWPSGLYYAKLTGPHGRWGDAVFVVRPQRLGEHRIAVVLPTNTWQAYNFYDENHDGKPDSWYPNPGFTTVHLTRPFLSHGIPPHFAGYDRGFLRWLALSGRHVDFLTDDDLERIDGGAALARSYDLVVFSGHEEYVTTHAYDITERYRDLGGNLMFLSANNFFWHVDRAGDFIRRTAMWRDLHRPEAALVGIQYVDWYQERYRNRPYVITGAGRVPWAFRGTGLHDGDRLGNYGIEVDARTADSPRGIRVLARIGDIFGPGKSAEMTYYETQRGAKVFAAGVMNFGGSALWPQVSPLLANLFAELSRP
jgi:hypothetical protein